MSSETFHKRSTLYKTNMAKISLEKLKPVLIQRKRVYKLDADIYLGTCHLYFVRDWIIQITKLLNLFLNISLPSG